MSNLNNKTIDTTYKSILNIGTESNPNATLSSSLSVISDGVGNDSSLSIATANNGIRITGQITNTGVLSAGNVRYPNVRGNSNEVLITDSSGSLFFSTIGPSSLSSIHPNPASTYTGPVSSITVSNKGLVTNVGVSPYTPGAIVWLTSPISLSTSNNNTYTKTAIPGIPTTATSVIIQVTQGRVTSSNGTTTQVFIKPTLASLLESTAMLHYSNDGNSNSGFSGQGTYQTSIDGSNVVVYIRHVRNGGFGSPNIKVLGYIQ